MIPRPSSPQGVAITTELSGPTFNKLHDDDEDDDDVDTLTQKKLKKLSKYKDLKIEVSRMWKVRINIVPVTIGALGTINPLATEFSLKF